MDPLFVTPAAIYRGLADLASLATSAQKLTALVSTLEPGQFSRALDDLHTLAQVAGRLERGLPAVGDVLDRIGDLDTQIIGVGTIVGGLEKDIASLGKIAPSVEALTRAAGTLADTVEPLQGVVERLARMADRLPGARGPRRAS